MRTLYSLDSPADQWLKILSKDDRQIRVCAACIAYVHACVCVDSNFYGICFELLCRWSDTHVASGHRSNQMRKWSAIPLTNAATQVSNIFTQTCTMCGPFDLVIAFFSSLLNRSRHYHSTSVNDVNVGDMQSIVTTATTNCSHNSFIRFIPNLDHLVPFINMVLKLRNQCMRSNYSY